jgi:hypothetical protein
MRLISTIAILSLLMSYSFSADDDLNKDIDILKREMERLSPSTICKIDVTYHSHDNGVIGSARVILPDIIIPNTHSASVNVVIKRRASFTKWKQTSDNNGWDLGKTTDYKIHYNLFRRFSINDAVIDLQIPDDLSYEYSSTILSYFISETKLTNVYKIEKKGEVIIIRTLDEYIGPLNARGLIYEIELNSLGQPVKLTQIGKWIS